MTLIRSSISINKELLEQAKQLAEAADTTFSGLVSKLIKTEIDRGKRTRELLAQWGVEDEQIFAKATSMTYDELWRDTPPLQEEEARQLHAQLDRVETRWRDENS